MKKRQDYTQGFSLIELMVTIGITAILAGVTIPKYQSYMANNRATVYSNQLLADLRYAKNLATLENASVTICQITAVGSIICNNGSTSWQKGWFVLSSATSTTRRNFQFNSALTANTNAGISVTGTQPLIFNNNGLPGSAYTFTIKPNGCSAGYQISVAADGTISKTTTTCP